MGLPQRRSRRRADPPHQCQGMAVHSTAATGSSQSGRKSHPGDSARDHLAPSHFLAPSAYQCLAHPDGELATALAAAAQHTGMVLSTQSSTPLEDVARLYRSQRESASPLWLQLYLQPQREHTLQLIARAEAAGYEALVLTVDAPLHGVRDAERRSRFRLPPHIGAVNLKGLQAMSPSETSSSLHTLLAHAPTWADVSWLVQQTRLPVLLKGILHPDDARSALDHGAQGVIVSNHGGRTLDTTCATAHALPGIAHAVGHQMSILVDGGIRRGTDVVKALCLGAHGVLIGRPVLHGLAHSGAMGVGHVIRLLLDEFQVAMALCGAASVADCSPELLVPGRFV